MTARLLSELTPVEIAAKAVELAKANPDYVYDAPNEDEFGAPSCQYVAHDEDGNLVGSCLFGQAIVALGVRPEDLLARNTVGIESLLNLPEGLHGTFGMAQGAQDVRTPWGDQAVLGALQHYVETAQ